jgi:acetyl esterase
MKLPGRLSDSQMTIRTDPRTHPTLIKMLPPSDAVEPPVDESMSLSELHHYIRGRHEAFEKLYARIPLDVPEIDSSLPEVVYRPTECLGSDGNTIKLHVYRPASSEAPGSKPLPCIMYFHGGGMTMINTTSAPHTRWVQTLAAQGMVAINVDFRNAWNPEGWNHFPAGLNDCAAAVKWAKANEQQLNITKIVLEGESGGGNLCIATALKANKEGWINTIAGVYSAIPTIGGPNVYGWEEERLLEELPSHLECEGYSGSTLKKKALTARAYDPEGKNATNPLAWPYQAEEKDLVGLPPFVISVNELDMLRDEGIAFWRKLVKAGVKAVGRVELGHIHGTNILLRSAMKEDYFALIGDIKRFADSL